MSRTSVFAVTLVLGWFFFGWFGDFNMYVVYPDGSRWIKEHATFSDRVIYGFLTALAFSMAQAALLWLFQKFRSRRGACHIAVVILLLCVVTSNADHTTLRRAWRSQEYSTNALPKMWCPKRIPTTVTNVAAFEQFASSESFSIPKFITRYGLPSRYLSTDRREGQDYLIYDLPSGHAVALYVSKPPVSIFAAAVIITADASLVRLFK